MLGVKACFLGLSDEAQRIVRDRFSFGDFVTFMCFFSRMTISKPLTRGLLDSFWDSTNTFHFSWGEMALTPFEFGVITGLRMTGEDLTWDARKPGRDDLRSLIGGGHTKIWKVTRSGFQTSRLREMLKDGKRRLPQQEATLFLWYMLSGQCSVRPLIGLTGSYGTW